MDDRVEAIERGCGLGEAQPVEIRAVGADQQDALAVLDHPPRRFRQALAEIAFTLGCEVEARRDLAAPVGMAGIGVGAELDRADGSRGGFAGRAMEHLRRERGRALGAQGGNEPRLHLPRHRRLGEDEDADHRRRQR